jgi:hypothetical protein
MPIDVQPPRISTSDTPRKILAADFETGGELPIRGGWGYSPEDAVIIDRDDPVAAKGTAFNGIAIEYDFVGKRIYEELVVLFPEGETHSEIKWNLLEQNLFGHDDRPFDRLAFEVTAIPGRDWEQLEAEWEGPNGWASPRFDAEEHRRKRESKTIRYLAEYYFDITSFFGSSRDLLYI